MIIYLAGAETWWERFKLAGIRNQLFSYYYLRKQRDSARMFESLREQRKLYEAKGLEFRLFLDSGAFTYQGDKGKKPDPAVYFREFKDFVRRTGDLWTVIAELDIDESADETTRRDLDQVEAWRDELYEVKGSAEILPVWHATRGREKWTEYCRDPRFPYLAFSSLVGDLGSKNRLCAEAHRNGKKVHGFAETKIQTEAKYLKADSVDSSTWLRATKYGGMFIFQGNKFRILDHKHKRDRRLFRSYFKNNGLDPDVLCQDEDKLDKNSPEYTIYQEELTRASLVAWRNLAERLERSGGRSGYQARPRNEAEQTEAVGSVDGSDQGQRFGRGGAIMARPRSRQPGSGRAERASTARSAEGQDGDQGAVREHAGTLPNTASVENSSSPDNEAQSWGELSIEIPEQWRLPACQDSAKESSPKAVTYYPFIGIIHLDPANPLSWLTTDGELLCLPFQPGPKPQAGIDKLGERLGCYSCGKRQPGLKGWHRALYPPGPGDKKVIRPQCADCHSKPQSMLRDIGDMQIAHPTERNPNDKSSGLGDADICARGYCGHRRDQHDTNGRPCKACLALPGSVGGCGSFLKEARNEGSALSADSATNNDAAVTLPGGDDSGDGKWTYDEPAVTCECGHGPSVHHFTGRGETSCMPGCRCTGFKRAAQEVAQPVLQSMEDAMNHVARNHPEEQGLRRDVDGKLYPAHVQEVAHLSQARSFGPVAEQGTGGKESSPKEGIQTVTVEGKRHLPVLQNTLSHDPDVEEAIKGIQSLPATTCNNCAMSGDCPEYEEGAVCFFTERFRKLTVRDSRHHIAIAEVLLTQDWERTQMALMQERVTAGGMLDPRVSQQMDGFLGRLLQYRELKNVRPATVTASVTVTGEGAVKSGGGILRELFGSVSATSDVEIDNIPSRGDVIDVPGDGMVKKP